MVVQGSDEEVVVPETLEDRLGIRATVTARRAAVAEHEARSARLFDLGAL